MRVGGRYYYDLPNVTRFLESGGDFSGKVPLARTGVVWRFVPSCSQFGNWNTKTAIQ